MQRGKWAGKLPAHFTIMAEIMSSIKITFKSSYPLMGAMRRPGDVLLEGKCPVKGITLHKLINAFMNAELDIEIKDDEKEPDRHGIGAVPGAGPSESPVHNQKRSRK
jgi:hypothetical protein